MTDSEISETLIALCEAVKAQSRYLGELHRSLAALYDAIKRDHPEIEAAYRGEASPIREHAGIRELFEQVDGLLQQLKKRQV